MPSVRVIVVGGSLSGLCAALALAAEGCEVSVYERDLELGAGGAGLGVDRALLERVVNASPFGSEGAPMLPVISSNRDSTAWVLLYQWLRQVIDRRTDIRVRHGAQIVGLEETDRGVAVLVGGVRHLADVVIGADGYRSLVRRLIAPDRPEATFAGYMLWRGLLDEAELPRGTPRLQPAPTVEVVWAHSYRFVAYYVPGADGSTQAGARRISWAWYDPFQSELLHALGAVEAGFVRHSIAPESIPSELLTTMQKQATAFWPEPWSSAVRVCLSQRSCFATPIAEYVPLRLTSGRTAIVGDAAHVCTPMTGSGLRYAMLDILALRQAMKGASASAAPSRLKMYERDRLAADRQLAQYGQQWSREYSAQARISPTTGQG